MEGPFSYVFCEVLFVPWEQADEIVLHLHSPLSDSLTGAFAQFRRDLAYGPLTSELRLRSRGRIEEAEQTIHPYQLSFQKELPINSNYSCLPIRMIPRSDEYYVDLVSKERFLQEEIESHQFYVWWGIEVDVPLGVQVYRQTANPQTEDHDDSSIVRLRKAYPWRAGRAYAIRFGLFARHPVARSQSTFLKRLGFERYEIHLLESQNNSQDASFIKRWRRVLLRRARQLLSVPEPPPIRSNPVTPTSRFWFFCDQETWCRPIFQAIKEAITNGIDPNDFSVRLIEAYRHSSLWVVVPSRINLRRLGKSRDDHFRYLGQANALITWPYPPLTQLTQYSWIPDDILTRDRFFYSANLDRLGVRFYVQLDQKRVNVLRLLLFTFSSSGMAALAAVYALSASWLVPPLDFVVRLLSNSRFGIEPSALGGIGGYALAGLTGLVWLGCWLLLYGVARYIDSTWSDDHPGG
jgi:hypothetical protein